MGWETMWAERWRCRCVGGGRFYENYGWKSINSQTNRHGMFSQTNGVFFGEVCFPPLLSFPLFSAAKHKKSRFYCFVLNRYAHTDARTLCIKSLLQQTHSKRERVKTGGLCTFFTRSSSLSPSLWLVIYVHWLGGLVSGKFQNKCLTKQQPTDENNAVIFAMCWLLLYTESPNDKKNGIEKRIAVQ